MSKTLGSDEDKWSHGGLHWLFSLCQLKDCTPDRRHTCLCAVLICHFCTVIVSFCPNASKLIRAESSRMLTRKKNKNSPTKWEMTFLLSPVYFLFQEGGIWKRRHLYYRCVSRGQGSHASSSPGCKFGVDRVPHNAPGWQRCGQSNGAHVNHQLRLWPRFTGCVLQAVFVTSGENTF